MSDFNPYASPNAVVADVFESEAAPPLWNPTAAGAWSLIFSPIFGAFLHMQNWKALGQPEKAAASRNWMFGSIAFFIVLGISSLFMPVSKGADAFARLGGLIVLIAWYYAIGKSQQTHIAARFGKTYPRRGWTIPLLSALGFFVVYAGFLFLLTLVLLSTGAIQVDI